MHPPAPITAYIALGSNLGARDRNIDAALDALGRTPGIRVVRRSALLENPSVGGPADAPPFLNAAAELETTLDPHPLLRRMLEVERSLGRVRRYRWEPRPIDLDLLLFGKTRLDEPALTLPHPLMHIRPFVLRPLAEIAPDLLHPVLGKTIAELLGDLAMAP